MTALWPYSNGAVQIRVGLELAEHFTVHKRLNAFCDTLAFLKQKKPPKLYHADPDM